MNTTRRSLITGLIAFVAAPAIVRAGSLMPIKVIPVEPFGVQWNNYGVIERTYWLMGDRLYITDRDGAVDIYAWGANGIGEPIVGDRHE